MVIMLLLHFNRERIPECWLCWWCSHHLYCSVRIATCEYAVVSVNSCYSCLRVVNLCNCHEKSPLLLAATSTVNLALIPSMHVCVYIYNYIYIYMYIYDVWEYVCIYVYDIYIYIYLYIYTYIYMVVDLNCFIPKWPSSRKKVTFATSSRNFRGDIFTYLCKLEPWVISISYNAATSFSMARVYGRYT